jgi:hypothetical protein
VTCDLFHSCETVAVLLTQLPSEDYRSEVEPIEVKMLKGNFVPVVLSDSTIYSEQYTAPLYGKN